MRQAKPTCLRAAILRGLDLGRLPTLLPGLLSSLVTSAQAAQVLRRESTLQ